jgi:hypothetical protein
MEKAIMFRSTDGRWVCGKAGGLNAMRVWIVLGGVALSTLVIPSAFADSYSAQPRQAEVAIERIPQEYVPVGVRLGVFDLLPELNVKETYSDNIFRTQSNKKDDFITTTSPLVQLKSDWARHELDFLASADVYKYINHDSENHDDYNIAFDGRVDIMRDMNVYGGAAYRQLHEDRGSPNDQNGLHPQQYNLASANTGYYNQFNRFSVRLDGSVNQYTYDDLATSTGTIKQNDRDHLDTQGTVRFGYEMMTGWEPFVRLNYIDSDYHLAQDRNGLNKDNSGYEADAGTAFNLNGIWAGEAFVGYLDRDFKDSRFSDVKDPTYGLALVANVTPLTSINAVVNKTISDSITLGSSSLTNTFYGLSADTEMRRNFVVGAGANFVHTEYDGITRIDDVTTVGTRAKYYFNRYFSVGPEISYVTRDAQNSGGADDYQNWIFLLRLTGRI